MFEATGPELGRAAFMNTLVTTPTFDNGIYAPVQFTADDHFGGTGAHLLDADCARSSTRRPSSSSPWAERWATLNDSSVGLLVGIGIAIAVV